MELSQYQQLAMGYMTDTVADDPVSYGLLNLAAETGEVCDKFAKSLRADEDIDDIAVLKELGDALWSLTCIANGMGYSLETVASMNLDKLGKRQIQGTIVGEGDDR